MHRYLSLTTTQYRLLALLWTLGIVGVCVLPARTLPEVQPGLKPDKFVHVGLFIGFGLLWIRGLCPPTEGLSPRCLRHRGLALFVGGSLLGGGVEIYQHFAPIRRMGDPYDVGANVLGLLVALSVYYVYHRRALSGTSTGSGTSFTEA